MRHLWICPGLGYKWGMSGILGLSAMAILLHRAINRTDSQITLGYQLYGIPVGTRGYVQHMLMEKVQEVRGDVELVKKVVGEEDGQAIWAILK